MSNDAFTEYPNPDDFTLTTKPLMRNDAIIQGDHWRIGLITDSLVRFEWSDCGEFEDHATQMALVRDFGTTPEYSVREDEWGRIVITTSALTITYDKQPFSPQGLSIVLRGLNSWMNTWTYGDSSAGHGPGGNLKGTARTLDEVDGRCELDDGVISHEGWGIIDDSSANILLFGDEAAQIHGQPNPFGSWTAPRAHHEQDFYFFGYAHQYRQAVIDLLRLTGGTPLLPRFALGNWWSRYYPYSQAEYLALQDRFKAEGIPFTTAVIDMDWHITAVDPKYGSGWTGYTWNRELIPDPQQFMADLHARGLHTTLNDHPRDGIRAFEEYYRDAAERMGRDEQSIEAGDPLNFDPADPVFMDASLAVHHALENDGVDFWWLDWQQGGISRQPGLDPLWMLNHLHYLDSGRTDATTGRKHWPLTFSRYAGPGSGRYSIGFSGDSIMSWASLQFQPEFTATASNIGYGWWSHDIGGHMLGVRDDELEARWYQLGTFSPMNRLHSSCSPFSGKEPWNFSTAARQAMVEALRLRHALLPYTYTMNYRAANELLPLIEPMYWTAPETRAAYEVPNEYWFGTELVIAPITQPAAHASMRGQTNVWLPAGQWFDFFDGRHYDATDTSSSDHADGGPSIFVGSSEGRSLTVWRTLDRIPVFAKAGGIIPLQPVAPAGPDINTVANPETLDVLVFPGACGEFTLVEDDGVFGDDPAHTQMTLQWSDTAPVQFTVNPITGNPNAIAAVPEARHWTLKFRGVADIAAQHICVTVSSDANGNGANNTADVLDASAYDVHYDASTLTLTVTLRDAVATSSSITVTFAAGALQVAKNPIEEDVQELLLRAQMPNLTKDLVLQMVREQGVRAIAQFATLVNAEDPEPGMLHANHLPADVAAAITEIALRS